MYKYALCVVSSVLGESYVTYRLLDRVAALQRKREELAVGKAVSLMLFSPTAAEEYYSNSGTRYHNPLRYGKWV